MFSTISSISPRVFISTPIDRLSFHDSPTNRAENVAPIILPAIDTTMNSAQIPHR